MSDQSPFVKSSPAHAAAAAEWSPTRRRALKDFPESEIVGSGAFYYRTACTSPKPTVYLFETIEAYRAAKAERARMGASNCGTPGCMGSNYHLAGRIVMPVPGWRIPGDWEE